MHLRKIERPCKTQVSEDPPLVSFSISKKRTTLKDTAANILATKEFVASMISMPFLEQSNVTCVDTPPDTSEWEIAGLTRVPSVSNRAILAEEELKCCVMPPSSQ